MSVEIDQSIELETTLLEAAATSALASALDAAAVEAEVRDFDVSMNVDWVVADSGESDTLIFINQAKLALPWFTPDGQNLEVDANGYPVTLGTAIVAATKLLDRTSSVDGIEPLTGSFRLYGQGTAKIQLAQDNVSIVDPVWTTDLPTEVIDGETYWYVDFTYASANDETGMRLRIHEIGEDYVDYLHDLALVHTSHLDEFLAGEVFAPEFVQDLIGYDTLRFMEWTGAIKYDNDATGAAIDPEGRYITTEYFTFNTLAGYEGNTNVFTSSVPIEYIVELANLTGANAWISLPVDITDARAESIATYVAATLDAGLSVYWEYGNELWNAAWGFEGYTYAEHYGSDLFGVTGITAVAEWAAYRGPQLYDLIAGVYGAAGVGTELHFVAGVSAEDIAGYGTWVNSASYSRIYFAAAGAQSLADAPSSPGEIITDYASGAYVGITDTKVLDHIKASYTTLEEQIAAMARWILFGSDDATSVALTTTSLTAPVTAVSYTAGMSISVASLVWNDRQAGLDMLTGLTQVLRLVGSELQYKGVNASSWTTVLVFDSDPGVTLDEMIADVELVGYSRWAYGGIMTGLLSSVANQSWIRIEGHQGFVSELGIDWIIYEGAVVTATGDDALYEAFRESDWTKVILDAWFDAWDAAGITNFAYYMAHARVDNDVYGAKDYAGESLSTAPVAAYLMETIAKTTTASNPDQQLSVDAATFDPQAWTSSGAGWVLDGAGAATEVNAGGDKLTLTSWSPITAGESYTLSFTVSSDVAAPGTLYVLVQARGGGMTKLVEWTGVVANGDQVTLDLGEIDAPRNALEIVIQRRPEGRTGTLTLSDLLVEVAADVVYDMPPTQELTMAAGSFSAEAWTSSGTGWVLDGTGAATELYAGGDKLALTTWSPVTAGESYTLSFTVGASVAAPGTLYVLVQARGSGMTTLVEWTGVVANGDQVTLDLGEIAAPRNAIEIIIQRRPEGRTGVLTLSNLLLEEVTYVMPATQELTMAAGSFSDEAWTSSGAGWLLDGTGAATELYAGGDKLALTTWSPVTAGESYSLSFTVSSDVADPGTLYVLVQARGSGVTTLVEWTGVVANGDQVTLDLGEIAAPRNAIEIVIQRRPEGRTGTLTLSDLLLEEVVPDPIGTV